MKITMDLLKENGIVDGINQEVYLGPVSINERTTKIPKTNEIYELNESPIRILRLNPMMSIGFRRPITR